MSLTERERRCLEDLAQEIMRDDPILARMLTRGRWLPRRARLWVAGMAFLASRRWWQWLFVVVMVGGVVVLLATVEAPRPVVVTVGAGILAIGSALLCGIRLLVHHRRRRAVP